MNARDRLDRALSSGVHLPSNTRQSLIDAFAHELAEEIREFVGPESYPHETDPLILRYVKGWRDAADRIDPKEKK